MTVTTTSIAPWYLLQVQSNFEDKVAETICNNIERHGLELKIHSVLVPKEEIQCIKNGRKQITKRRLYPGYLMIQMNFDNDVWHFLKKIPHVRGFIGGAAPTQMKANEIKHIFNIMQSSSIAPKHKVEFSIGQNVRVIEGPFKDFQAVVERVDYNKNRLNVSVTIFGRSTNITLAFSDVAQN